MRLTSEAGGRLFCVEPSSASAAYCDNKRLPMPHRVRQLSVSFIQYLLFKIEAESLMAKEIKS